MVIIGEKLNSSSPDVKVMLDKRDAKTAQSLIQKQVHAGARFIDINTSMAQDPYGALIWAVKLAMQAGDCGICVDVSDADMLVKLYSEVALPDSIINSITLEEEKLEKLLPVAKKYGAGVIAMPIHKGGIPKSAEERVANASELVEILVKSGIQKENIFVDIVVEAAQANHRGPFEALIAARELHERYPNVKLVAGISNVSFGLPQRPALNRAYLTCAMSAGLDAAILDPLDEELMMQLAATELLLGRDEDSMAYIATCRAIKPV
ncbi:dihydropteroate synthase [Christensenellaceae bacterium OttesenSCG-928-K19]|nr:dihydropteroate synthase [Christensenellaceae bacterium OttesenSCG-928-K19]